MWPLIKENDNFVIFTSMRTEKPKSPDDPHAELLPECILHIEIGYNSFHSRLFRNTHFRLETAFEGYDELTATTANGIISQPDGSDTRLHTP